MCCDCSTSKYCYAPVGHIITGDLNLVKGAKLDSDLAALNRNVSHKRCILLWMKCKSRSNQVVITQIVFLVSVMECMTKWPTKFVRLMRLLKSSGRNTMNGKYSPEQLRCWTRLLQINQYDSYESPLNKPFFKTKQATINTSVSAEISPGEKVGLRPECIDQLDKWHDLKVCGVISNEECQEMKDPILNDMKQF